MTIAVQAEGLTKRFGDTQALDGVDLAVPAGTVLGLLGPNGSGKTTTVRILATLLAPDAGRATVAGFDLAARPMAVRAAIGLTGQYAAVDENLTGRENLELIGNLLELQRPVRRDRAAALLERVALEDAADRVVRTYSGGMHRRLDLAASLVGRPRVLFLDEPTTGLDPGSRRSLWTMIRELIAEGTTVLLTTQYLEEADQLADRIVVLDHGRVIAEGSSDELKARAGEQVLEVRPAAGVDLDGVAVLLSGLAGGTAGVDAGARLVTLPAPGSEVLTEVVRRLDAAGVALDDLSLRRPSLDDVFLRLTGTRAEDQDANADSGADPGADADAGAGGGRGRRGRGRRGARGKERAA